MARLDDDLYRWCEASARGGLGALPAAPRFARDSAVVVVAAAAGYPEMPAKGARLEGELLPAPEYFYAGVAKGAVSGGRVFGAMGMAPSLAGARAQAYERITQLRFSGMHYRKDIGGKS